MVSLKSSPVWKALAKHRVKIAGRPMRDLFAKDAERFRRFSIGRDGLFLDYSKNRITAETVKLLLRLAKAADVEGARKRLFAGDVVNATEGRAALHMALRAHAGDPVGSKEARARALRERKRIRRFADDVASGRRAGQGGRAYRAAVVLGIGGSHLGPEMAVDALDAYRRDGFEVRFVSSMDPAALKRGLRGLDPRTTLAVVQSKTFTTEETMANARAVRVWLAGAVGERQALAQMAAVSADGDAVERFGIACDDTFLVWDWVGGRYSATSAMGLPVALACGAKRFEEFLDGARAMDRHFQKAALEKNMPAMLALVGIWNSDFLGLPAQAIVPYDDGLGRFPDFLQQLVMESNGKSVGIDGKRLRAGGAPVVFGGAGTAVQHAFFQALHQGRQPLAVDFIAVAEDGPGVARLAGHRRRLNANLLAQAEALMTGRTEAEAEAAMLDAGLTAAEARRLAPHRAFPGNRPSNAIVLDRLDPAALGRLVALYEHRVFVEAVVWGLNPFDQWGVELGKELARGILPALEGRATVKGHDSSTTGLVKRLKAKKRGKRQ